MKTGLLRILGTLIAVVVLSSFYVMTQHELEPFEHAEFPILESLTSADEAGEAVIYVLWGQRQFDLIALALLLFVSAACCATILRMAEGHEG